jgi:hypothetical protein
MKEEVYCFMAPGERIEVAGGLIGDVMVVGVAGFVLRDCSAGVVVGAGVGVGHGFSREVHSCH